MFIHVYTFIYITLQNYQKMCHIVRKSFCFERNHFLLEMLHFARKVYDYYYALGISFQTCRYMNNY